MSDNLAWLLILSVVASAIWLRSAFRSRPGVNRLKTLVFLVLETREFDKELGIDIPKTSRYLRRAVYLKSPPVPGIELDGLGVGPVRISRVQVQENADFDAFLYLDPVKIGADEIDSHAQELIKYGSWEPLSFDPR
mgnify:CR=1 FL=1